MPWVQYGNYEINNTGSVRRLIPAQGTRIGKRLKPYTPYNYVKLHQPWGTMQISRDEAISIWNMTYYYQERVNRRQGAQNGR